MNQTFSEKLEMLFHNIIINEFLQHEKSSSSLKTMTASLVDREGELSQAILELIKESVPEPYLVDVKRDDFKEAIGWNGCRTELLKQFGMEE